VASNITVNFPAPGVYPYELDYAKGGDKNLTLTLQSGGIPIPAAALLTLTPNNPPSIQVDQVQTLNVAATDSEGLAGCAEAGMGCLLPQVSSLTWFVFG
jgi:hypothetical protein